MFVHDLLPQAGDGAAGGGELGQHVGAVLVRLDHLFDMLQVADDPADAVELPLFLLRGMEVGIAVGMGVLVVMLMVMLVFVGVLMLMLVGVVVLVLVLVGHGLALPSFLSVYPTQAVSATPAGGYFRNRWLLHRCIFWPVPSTSDTSLTVTKAKGSISRRMDLTWGIWKRFTTK